MKNVHVFVPVFLDAVTKLIFEIKRITSSEKWCKYVITFFFFENAKNLGRSYDGKRRKKRGCPYYYYLGLLLLLQEKVTFMDTKKIG